MSMRTRVQSRRVWMTLAGVMLLMIAIVVITGLGADIQQHAQRVSVSSLSADQRWGAWADGFQAAMAHLPSGSGLGTYGYASLAFQNEPRPEWFREAHNQYLESFTEMGVIGISIVIAGLIWFSRVTYRLLQTVNSKMRLGSVRWAWGMIGISLLVCGAVQNAFDFVIKVPAILLLYSVLITLVATTRLHASRKADHGPALRATNRKTAAPYAQAVWLTVGLLGVVAAGRIADRQVISDRALGASSMTGITINETQQAVGVTQLKLNAAIASQPENPALYLRRAINGQRKYQQRLIEVARQSGTTLTQQNSRIETIHALLVSVPRANRDALRSDFLADPELRETLAETITDLRAAILLNPYQPHAHYRCALISPLGTYSLDPWLNRSIALANNHTEILFNNGLLAYYQNDQQRMVDQWSRSLKINHNRMQTMIDLAAKKTPVLTIAQHLVPDNRPDRIVALASPSATTAEDATEHLSLSELLKYVQQSTRFHPAKRHATLAGLYELQGNQHRAIQHWKQAMILQPMNQKFRFAFVDSLRRNQLWEEALDQAVLGQRLFPTDLRFERQAKAIRRNMIDL